MLIDDGKIFTVIVDEPISLMSLRAVYPSLFYTQSWYNGEPFANSNLQYGHYDLSQKTVQTEGIFPDGPPAGVCAYLYILWFDWTGGERLWEREYVWCSDRDSEGDQVYVGGSAKGSGGLQIHRHISLKPYHKVLPFSFRP